MVDNNDITMICDTSTRHQRPFLPSTCRHQVFDVMYSLSHPSIRATQHLLTTNYIWPRIDSDVRT